MEPVQTLNCPYIGKCGGCPWGGRSYAEQLREKHAPILELDPHLDSLPTPMTRVRDRADLIWERSPAGIMQLGLYALGERRVVDIEACVMMSEPLEAWFKEFRQRAPPITRGSVRLRVSPTGARGVWLDFANSDVKELFSEKSYLQWLSELAFVEIGQRRKALVWRDGHPKLVNPILNPWFETYGPNDQAIPLFGPVGGFSQAGFAANRALVRAVCDLVKESGGREWLELFSGNGNFALALAAHGYDVEAVELDELAVQGMKMSSEAAGVKSLRALRGDVYLKTASLPPLSGRGLLVDPPRAGLRELLAQLENGERPENLIYVSCFSEVFLTDAEKLKSLGYRLHKVIGVDQFPFTPHSEWVALFTTNK